MSLHYQSVGGREHRLTEGFAVLLLLHRLCGEDIAPAASMIISRS